MKGRINLFALVNKEDYWLGDTAIEKYFSSLKNIENSCMSQTGGFSVVIL